MTPSITRTPDVLIIGAGVIGASIAWHLLREGWESVTIIDRAASPASGSTARATGGFRVQFGSDVNVRLSLLSREKLLRFADEVGADPGYVPAGYLFVATTDDELAALSEAIDVQRNAGFDETTLVTSREAREINPHVHPSACIGGTFSPRDGFIRPLQIADGYLSGAKRMGAEVILEAEALTLDVSGGRVTSVHTRTGSFAPGIVVNAAGAWAGDVVRAAGVSLPVMPLRRQVACTLPDPALDAMMPMTIWAGDGFHVRVRDERLLLLWPHAPSNPADDAFESSWLSHVERMARERVPELAQIPIDREHCWAGMYEMSPDHHAIVGRSAELENLLLANGSSGHGVMHAPAIGQIVAEIATLGAARSIDASPLRPSRFAENDPVPGSALL